MINTSHNIRHLHPCAKALSYIIPCGNTYYSYRRSSSAQQLYVVSTSNCFQFVVDGRTLGVIRHWSFWLTTVGVAFTWILFAISIYTHLGCRSWALNQNIPCAFLYKHSTQELLDLGLIDPPALCFRYQFSCKKFQLNNIKSGQLKLNSLIKTIILYCMPGVFCARVGEGRGRG